MNPISNVLDRLDDVRETDFGWEAKCPACDDRDTSLEVRKGRQGQASLNCRAGCSRGDVFAAAGLSWGDLYPDDAQGDGAASERPAAPPEPPENGRADGAGGTAREQPENRSRAEHDDGGVPPGAETSEAIGEALRESTRNTRPGPEIGSLVSDVEAKSVSWLWERRFPVGALGVLDGDPGLGKSTMLADITARLTAGRPMPGERVPVPYRNGAGVVYVTVEDSVAHTIRPRLEAAGAVLNRVCVVQSVPSEDGGPDMVPVIPDDLHHLRLAVEDVAARLVVIDPLMAHLPGDVNSFRDQDVRAALGPLATFAEEAGVAVLCVRHLNKKTGGPALYRGGASIGIIGAARVGLLLGTDPEDEDRRVLAPLKNNLSRPASSLAFRLVDGGGDYNAARVEWEGEVALSAQDLLAPPERKDTKKEAAKDWIVEKLSDGPRPSAEMYDEAEADGLAKRTLKRARREVADAERTGGTGSGGYWQWRLKDRYAKGANTPKNANASPKNASGGGPLSGEAAPNVSESGILRDNHPETPPQNGAKSSSKHSVPKGAKGGGTLSGTLSERGPSGEPANAKNANEPRHSSLATGDRVRTPDGEGEVLELTDAGRVAVRHDDDAFGTTDRAFDPQDVEALS